MPTQEDTLLCDCRVHFCSALESLETDQMKQSLEVCLKSFENGTFYDIGGKKSRKDGTKIRKMYILS